MSQFVKCVSVFVASALLPFVAFAESASLTKAGGGMHATDLNGSNIPSHSQNPAWHENQISNQVKHSAKNVKRHAKYKRKANQCNKLKPALREVCLKQLTEKQQLHSKWHAEKSAMKQRHHREMQAARQSLQHRRGVNQHTS